MELNYIDVLLHTLKSLKIINSSKDNNNLIDLSNVDIISPFFIVPLTSYINSKNYDFDFIKPKTEKKISYLNTLKFPNTTSNDRDLDKIGKNTYCPLYEIKNDMFGDNYKILNIIEKIILNKYSLQKHKNSFMFVFDELMCNIKEHAKSKFNCIQAQMYDEKLAICLVDTGITIPKNYIEEGIRGYENNLELLKLVFKGISTKPEKERGTGIPNTYNIICNGFIGAFLVISGDVGFLKLPNNNIEFFDLKELGLKFEGTIINILFEIPKTPINIYEFINKPLNFEK